MIDTLLSCRNVAAAMIDYSKRNGKNSSTYWHEFNCLTVAVNVLRGIPAPNDTVYDVIVFCTMQLASNEQLEHIVQDESLKALSRKQREAYAEVLRHLPKMRPMSLEEVRGHCEQLDAAPLWCETRDESGWLYAVSYDEETWSVEMALNKWPGDYGIDWRCWYKKPDEESRKAATWEVSTGD